MASGGELVGRVLDRRYRLITKLGAGASAEVYLADDVRLMRRVAVKLLHPAFAEDEVFLERFRVEAQSAAALNHPHVLAVYDWGHDGLPYLVSEYLGGGTLRSVFSTAGTLSPSQALMVGLEAARGLDYAHRQGIVHRDIKPGNLLFDSEERLRIADFGIARALAEAAWTEPAGVVLGTAKYASPEQAQGVALDGKSDVYALALVLHEAVTGEVPFVTDSTLGTLMARVDQAVPTPPELGPLAEAVGLAGRPDPVDRIDAGQFAAALIAAAEDMPRPEPLPLAKPERGPVAPFLEGDDARTEIGTFDDIELDDVGVARSPEPVLDEEHDRASWVGIAASIVAVFAIAVGAVLWLSRGGVEEVEIPEFTGMEFEAAEAEAVELGLVVDRKQVRESGSVEGLVLRTDPPAGESVEVGETIAITSSLGLPMVRVPAEVVGQSLADATAVLEADGLELGEVTFEKSDDLVQGFVIRIDAEAQLEEGSAVDLVVSDGPLPRGVPAGLEGTLFELAVDELDALGLLAEEQREFSAEFDAGQVIRLEPAPGTELPVGSTVIVVVSDGPEPIPMPDVVGLTVDDAEIELRAIGLSVEVDGPPNGEVIGTDPLADELVEIGTVVTLVTREA